MIIVLRRAWDPTQMVEAPCAICGEGFEVKSVVAEGFAEYGGESQMGYLCPACIEHMGRHPSGRFPAIEEYRAALERFPAPLYPSREEFYREHPHLDGVWELSEIPRA